MNDEIKIETQGRILQGEDAGWGIFIEDLHEGESSYLILVTSPDHLDGYDGWVENFECLQEYFREANWKVEWFEKQTPPEIKIETHGRILQGEDAGWDIFIKDLDQGKGSYLISVKSPDKSKGYDRQVVNHDHLEAYFREANWKVEWLDEKQPNK